MKTLKIIQEKVTGGLSVELIFNENSRQCINVGAFIKAHPQYNKYLDEDEFKNFPLDDGNIVWGEDWDLIFPIEQLHAGHIA